jgi:predicted PurR-regulated permease PerM
MNPDRAGVARRFFTVLLVASIVLLVLVIRPIGTALFLAAVLAGSLWPLQQRLQRWLAERGRRGGSSPRKIGGASRAIAAACLVLAVVLLILGPLVAFSTLLVKEIAEALKFLADTIRSNGVTGLREHLPEGINRVLGMVVDWLQKQTDGQLDQGMVQRQVTAQGGRAFLAVGAAVSATGSLLFQGLMMVIALYFLLVEGDELVAWLDRICPLRPGQTRELLTEFKKVSYAVIVSTVITSGAQTLAASIGFVVARLPNTIFFAGLTFVAAFIPALGAASVCLVAAAVLFVTGHPYAALFLAIWGVTVVGLVDNIVKPYLIKAGMELRGAVVFFALIGGLGAFGTTGLLLGPLVVAAFLALIRMYERDFKAKPGVETDTRA